MVLTDVAVSAANAMRWAIEDAEQKSAEGYRDSIRDFLEENVPYYFQHLREITEHRMSNPMKIVSGGEIGLNPIPAIDLGEFLLALSLEAGNRRLLVFTNSRRPSLVGVVQGEPKPKADDAGMTDWDRGLTSVLSQNAKRMHQVIE